MKPSCRNCHFLAKSYRADNGALQTYSWSEKDRASGVPLDHYTPHCYFSVWDIGIKHTLADSLNDIIDENRKRTCFFRPAQQGMSFEAAKILQEREAQNAQLRRSNLYTQIGLWIAALALVANVLVAVVAE